MHTQYTCNECIWPCAKHGLRDSTCKGLPRAGDVPYPLLHPLHEDVTTISPSIIKHDI